MQMHAPRYCFLAVLLSAMPVHAAGPSAADLAFYEKEVQPLLQAKCLKCHGSGEKIRGNLRLTSRAGVLKGGDLGPAVVLDKKDSSPLLHAINYTDGLEMPPNGKLDPKQIEVLTRWVKLDVPMTGSDEKVVATHAPGGKVTAESRNYWAYKPVRRPEVPGVKDAGWVLNPVDAFVLNKLEAKQLHPAGPADRLALCRRVYYDLIGLPPTPAQIDAFVKDTAPSAYEKLIDQLLASPHYGEKWGRHWLDVARYAETNGYERDGPKPFAWRYRDYVVKSFNEDKPFDRFIREQLAGDEMPGREADAIIATGFYRLGLWDDEPADPLAARFDELDDLVTTTGQAFLGMTMNCARCHDHKIDPIPQADYYRMVAFFQDIPRFSNTRDTHSNNNLTDITPAAERAKYEEDLAKREARIAELTKLMTAIEDEAIRKMPAEDQRAAEANDRPAVVARKLDGFLTPEQKPRYAKLKKERETLAKTPQPRRDLALSVNHCLRNPPQTHVLIRGNAHSPKDPVEPGVPVVLASETHAVKPTPRAESSGRRTALAEWVAAPSNPATGRVFVNRLWQHHFGRGIVATPNDFGKFGTPPTHPELLDWLASDFVENGWRIKRMHKLLMLSNAYQMSARPDADNLRLDPANALFGRFNMRRLTAEEVRDSMLAVSGKLNLAVGGPSVYPPIPKEVLAGQSVPGSGWGQATPEEASRRSIYVHVKRSLLVPILSVHDQADTDNTCPVRFTTVVPTQALGLLNGAFANEQALAFAERLRREAPKDIGEQVRRAIHLTTGRSAGDAEVQHDVAFIAQLQAKGAADPLKQYCLLALNANEFVYLD